MPNANTLLNNGYKILNNSLCRSSKLDAEVLLSSVLKKKIEEIVLTRSILVSKEDETNYQRLIFRRKQGEPIAYILNKKEFWKNTFYVNKNVLIPRPDTEVIVEEAIKLIDKTKQKLILDIGTGSGCIIISLLKERPNIIDHYNVKSKILPLKKLKILDIGCGGGLLCEPMSRLGAEVTGIDASQKNINVAKIHSKKKKLNIKYICSSPENLRINKKFDIILNMEIIEHVDDVKLFLRNSSKFLKKNGIMYVATLNKTLKSYLFAIVGAEYILRWLPIGTHEWNKFVKPSELVSHAKANSMRIKKVDGVVFNPLNNTWDINNDKSVNYIALFEKV